MPSCVQFKSRASSEIAMLAAVDESVCSHFHVDPDPERFYEGWFDTIGLLLAMDRRGVELRDEIRRVWGDDDSQMKLMLELAKFLEATYDIGSWTVIGKFYE